jgi:hypothetical protein
LGGASLLGLTTAVQADSDRIQWKDNQHFYQRFDQRLTWTEAKKACEMQGATLVTITSAAEQSFVVNSLGTFRQFEDFWIGASDAAKEGKYIWVTGEKFSYQNWYFFASFGDTNDYVDFTFDRSSTSSGDYTWNLWEGTANAGYICEWSANNYTAVTTVPDMNADGTAEIAALYVDYVNLKHTVVIRDPKADKVLNTLTFKSGAIPPQGMVAIADINGNGIPEIGLLYTEFGVPSVVIKDASDNKTFLNPIRFLSNAYNPKEITVSPDSNGNGFSEITVLGIGKSKNDPKAETRDSSTGALLEDTKF